MNRGSLVIVRGGGDLGTGVVHRLVRAGYRVAVLESEEPTAVRRLVSFAEAVRNGSFTVEGVEARLVEAGDLEALVAPRDPPTGDAAGWPDWVPVVADPHGRSLELLRPDAIVDARMAKRNPGTSLVDAPVTIGLGPGFAAGVDVDLVVETLRGHSLGRVIENGAAAADTRIPGRVAGVDEGRVVRAPAAGVFVSKRAIGDLVAEGDTVGSVGGKAVRARTGGVVRGLIADGVNVRPGLKIGDVDPRGAEIDPGKISDKARAVGGAVVEALLSRGILPRPAGGGGS